MKQLIYAIFTIITLFTLSRAVSEESTHSFIERYDADQFVDTQNFIGGSLSSDEKYLLYSSDADGIFNIYRQEISTGRVEQLTYSKNHAYMLIDKLPQGEGFLFQSDECGNELSHIWLWEPNGTIKDLTPYPGAHCEFYQWSHDGKSFYFGCNAHDARFMDLYEMDITTLSPVRLFENHYGWEFGCVSSNKRYAAFNKMHCAINTDIYLYDLLEKTIQLVLRPNDDSVNHPVCFSKDSSDLYFLTDQDSDFRYLKKYHLMTKQSETIARYEWDINQFSISHNGRYHVTSINEDGRSRLEIFDQVSQKIHELPNFPLGQILWTKISKNEKTMIVAVNGSCSPTNLYLYHFDQKSCLQLTRSLSKAINASHLVPAKIIRFASYDGMEIPALFYMPKGIPINKKIPALIWMHGGPGGQSTDDYNSFIQYLANHGYAVLAVNNRGSSGYGKTFYSAADRRHGEADLGDCISAKEFLLAIGQIDQDKIGIIGGSYGGYLTLAALAFRPDSMAVGIDIFGVSNWIRTINSFPKWWEPIRQLLYEKIGHPVHDHEYLQSISPLFHAERICKPLLVIQGANDPRVLKIESDQIVEAVRKNGVPCEYLIFDDEGHGFNKKINKKIALESILKFLQTYLSAEELADNESL